MLSALWRAHTETIRVIRLPVAHFRPKVPLKYLVLKYQQSHKVAALISTPTRKRGCWLCVLYAAGGRSYLDRTKGRDRIHLVR